MELQGPVHSPEGDASVLIIISEVRGEVNPRKLRSCLRYRAYSGAQMPPP